MTTSFYIFLVCSIIALFPAYWDHGKTWKEVKSGKGKKKLQKMLKLFVLWSVPVLGVFGTVFLGIEGMSDDRRYSAVTNSLAEVQSKYSEATNDLAVAKQAASDAIAAASDASSQAKQLSGANSQIKELDVKIQDRVITQEQREEFILLLAHAPKGVACVVISANSGSEIETYARQISEMLASAGYGGSFASDFGIRVPKGVSVAVRSKDGAPPFASGIFKAFKAIKIDAVGLLGDPGAGNATVYVGGKP